MNSFGKNLKGLRKARGVSQKELATKLSISQGTIANYEKDNRFPKEKIMITIADYFEVSVDYLMGRISANQAKNIDPVKELKAIKYLDFSLIDDSFYEFASGYYFDLIIKNEMESAYLLVNEIYKNGGELLDIYTEIFGKTLIKIGDLWEHGELDVVTEHHFSAQTEDVMTRLYFSVEREVTSTKKVLCMCVEGEEHVIGCKIISHFSSYMGHASFYIGKNVPYKALEQYVRKNKIDKLVISVTMKERELELDNLLKFISTSEVLNKIEIILGGQFFKYKESIQKYNNYNISRTIEEVVKSLGK